MKIETTVPTEQIVSIQETLRPALPLILGCHEYHEQVAHLKRTNRILIRSGIQSLFVRLSLEEYEAKMAAEGKKVEGWMKSRYAKKSEQALRCNLLRSTLGESFRGISKRLAECPLFREFCQLDEFEKVRIPGKSMLQEYENWLPLEKMKQVLDALTLALGDEKKAEEIGLEKALEMEIAYIDTTCLEANIHFPADWILMRDAVRGLIKSILTTRRHGLKKKMPEPSSFIKEMNSLCIAMSAAGRKPESKKLKKDTLRLMKRLTNVVRGHAKRYRAALDQEWAKTDLTRKQAEVILRRIDSILTQLPEAMRQAHERIIGERKIASAKKILSLHESDIHVINRGKHGAQIEFGNTLLLAEESSGYILAHELLKEYSPGDAKLLIKNCDQLQRVTNNRLTSLSADRQFCSAGTTKLLVGKNIYNGICPKDPKKLSEQMKEEDQRLKKLLRRRAQTEARIGILKNIFLQETPKAKGYEHRAMQVTWAVLAHNLWVVARRGRWKEEEEIIPLTA